jgi:hypothetical protein
MLNKVNQLLYIYIFAFKNDFTVWLFNARKGCSINKSHCSAVLQKRVYHQGTLKAYSVTLKAMRESFTEILLPLFSIINIAFSYRHWLAQHDVLHNIMVFFIPC